MLKVSVIITAYNRCEQLKTVLENLTAQTTGGEFLYEVAVVDNNSGDATKGVVESYIPEFSSAAMKNKCLGLTYIFEPAQGKSHALNRGIREVKGDYIFFSDDDVRIDKNWLKSGMDCFRAYKCDGVGGRVIPVYPDDTPAWIRREDKNRMAGVVVTYDYGEGTRKYDPSMDEFIGANYGFKRQVFEDCGNFRTEFSKMSVPVGEDREFIYRVLSKGKVLYYCGSAVVWHPVDIARAKLKNVAKWNIALGRASAQRELEQGLQFKHMFGFPQYLLRGVIWDFARLFPALFSRPALFHALRRFYRKVGMIKEYRELKKHEL